MEVETGLRKFLLADAAVAGYVQSRVYKHRLEDLVDETGQRAIVVKREGGWTLPQEVTTQEYPKIRLELWSDHARGADGEILTLDGLNGSYAMYRTIDPLIHGKRDQRWGDLFVVGCHRFGEPFELQDPDMEAARVVVDYAVQVIH